MAKKFRERRNTRFSVSTSNRTERQLSALATSCGKSKAEIGNEIWRIFLERPELINELQDRFNKHASSRITGFVLNQHGNIEFLVGKKKPPRFKTVEDGVLFRDEAISDWDVTCYCKGKCTCPRYNFED
jgi:hypothetical protein